MRRAFGRLVLGLFAILLIAGCSVNKRANIQNSHAISNWHGRMAVQVRLASDSPVAAPQSFSASFELSGDSETGQLTLFTPFGSTAVRVHWQPGFAEIATPGRTRRTDNLSALLQEVVGTDLPLSALFAWLQGQDVPADGWQVDLSQWPQGKIMAQKQSEPQAQLRLILEP